MKTFDRNIKKTLLYNLIIFDFILLEASTYKISNFFIEKFETSSTSNRLLQKKFLRLSLNEIVKSFKRFIRLLSFLKKIKKKSLITIIANSEQHVELAKILFKQYHLTCLINFNHRSLMSTSSTFLKSVLFLEYSFNKSHFLSFFLKNFFLLQTINSFEDNLHYSLYKIFSSLEDYKKLIFLNLILISIFKK